jgi:hypothetical protein
MQLSEKPPNNSRPPRRTIHKFDPLGFAKDLQASGFTREQAEGLATRMKAEQSAFIDDRLAHEEDITVLRGDIEALHISTRADIDALRISTKADIDALRISTKADIEKTADRTKYEIVKWMFGAVTAQTVILLAAMVGILRAGAH